MTATFAVLGSGVVFYGRHGHATTMETMHSLLVSRGLGKRSVGSFIILLRRWLLQVEVSVVSRSRLLQGFGVRVGDK